MEQYGNTTDTIALTKNNVASYTPGTLSALAVHRSCFMSRLNTLNNSPNMRQNTTMSHIHNPHDKFFRQVMRYQVVAQDFFRHHLPLELAQTIDLDSLRLLETSYINEELAESFSDLVYEARHWFS